MGLPDHHHQPPGRAERPPDVGERGDGVVEEHRAEPADDQVEALDRKAVSLRIGTLEGDVVQPFGPGEFGGARDGRCGDIDPDSAARPSQPAGLTGGLPASASDVQDVVGWPYCPGPPQYLGV